MAENTVPEKNTAYTFYVALVDSASRPDLRTNPTLAAGDVQVSTDGAAFGNLTTLPVVTPAGGHAVKVDLSAAEMNGDNVTVRFVDAAGGEWDDLFIEIRPATRKLEDLAFPTVSGRSIDTTTGGAVGVDWGNVENQGTTVDLSATDINLVDTATTVTNAVNLPTIPANWITAAGIANDAIGATEIANGAIDAATFAAGAINAAAIATGAIDADAIATDAITSAKIAAGAITSSEAPNLDAAISTRATPAQVNTEVDTALTDIHLDHLFAADYDPATPPGVATAYLNEIAESDGGVTRFTQNALEQGPVATGFSTHTAADVWTSGTRTLTGLGFVLAAGDFGASSLDGKGDWNIGKTGYSISGTITTLDGLNDLSAAQVNAEVSDVLKTDTIALPGQAAPPLTPTFEECVSWLYKTLRNRTTQTATQWSLYADDESTVDAKATVSDDGTTATKQEIVTGP